MNKNGYFDKLNPQQELAVKAVQGPVMVLAGAGSGKTRVLTNRIAYMVDSLGIDPDCILAITFTNKAADEMKRRLSSMLYDTGRMLVSTIHSMCTRILRFEADSLEGYSPNFTIYTTTETEHTVKLAVKKLKLSDKEAESNFIYHISSAKNQGMSFDDYYNEALRYELFGETVLEVMREYERSLKRSNAMDFDDLLVNTYRLFRNNPEVLAKYQKRFKYISVDEFQDTNRIQYMLITLLAAKERNLFVVGDDDQSIYGWRGADVRNLLDFKRDYPESQVIKLEQNYRSTKKILNVANAVISKNTDRHEKKLWTDNSDGVKIEMYTAGSESDEAFYVISQIESLVRFAGYGYRDCAILMRINATSRSFEQECIKYGISYKVYGGFKFFERKEIKDMMAYLRIIDNPFDDDAFYRVINFPRRGIGETTISKLRAFSDLRNISAMDAASRISEVEGISSATKSKILDYFMLISDFAVSAVEMKLTEFIQLLFDELNLRDAYANDRKGDADKDLYVDEFIQATNDFAKSNPNAGLGDFLQSVSLQSDIDSMDESDNVTIATVHSAKGLEFKAVFVVGLEQGMFPSSRAYFDDTQMHEERRLMYVAVTRAMERLYLTRSTSRFLYGQRKEQAPSVFYKEVEGILKPPLPIKKVEYTVSTHWDEGKALKTPKTVKNTQYKAGDRLVHKMFGKGYVVAVKGDIIDVAFDGIGVKTLAAAFAPIHKED